MKRVLTVVALMGIAVVGANDVARAQVNGWENLRRSNGSLRPDSYTAGRAVQGSRNHGTHGNQPGAAIQQPHGGGHDAHQGRQGHGAVHNHGQFGNGGGYGYQPYYNPYYRPYYRYPTYYSRPYYYTPPVFIPAGQLFGPAAMRRFMGVR